MASAVDIVGRVRALGGNVLLDQKKLVIVNRAKLPVGVIEAIKGQSRQIAEFLDREATFDERAAIMEYDGGLTRVAAEYLTKLLITQRPRGAEAADWSWFCSEAVKIINAHFGEAA